MQQVFNIDEVTAFISGAEEINFIGMFQLLIEVVEELFSKSGTIGRKHSQADGFKTEEAMVFLKEVFTLQFMKAIGRNRCRQLRF